MGETRFAQTKRPFLTQCHPFSLCGVSRTTSHSRNGAAWKQIQTIADKDMLKNPYSLMYNAYVFMRIRKLRLYLLSFFLNICYFPSNQTKSILHSCQHRLLRTCRPVEDRIRSLPMTEKSGVWAKRICRAVIGKRSKATSVFGGDFFSSA